MERKAFKEAHKTYNNQQTNKIIGLVKPRLETLDDISKVCGFFYVDPVVFSEKSLKKFKNTNSDEILKSLAMLLEKEEDQENLKEQLKALSKEKDWGFGKVLGLLRLSIVGDLLIRDFVSVFVLYPYSDLISFNNLFSQFLPEYPQYEKLGCPTYCSSDISLFIKNCLASLFCENINL